MSNRVLEGFLGLCVGDALGVPVEFVSRDQLLKLPVTNMTGFGTHNQPPGTWSDDSSLSFCLAESLCNGFDIVDISQRFVRWYVDGYWTPHGIVFDIGNATLQAINRIISGCKPEDAGGKTDGDNGNGSLMRILPLAYYLLRFDDIETRMKIVHDVSAITHGHIRSKMACVLFIELAISILKGKNKIEAYNDVIKQFESIYSYDLYTTELIHFKNIISGKIDNLERYKISSSGYVIHTLEASIWCLLNSGDYKEAVLKAVNLGDDTDTTAAVTGGLAGIYYGMGSIPKEWIDVLARKDDIFALCERFAKNMNT
ncbi:MAG: ADP-ribosylglycohydrolase family protein [Acidobacteriota bacterium]